jgi:hypothetical protein
MSKWDAPPQRKNRIVDLDRGRRAALTGAAIAGRPKAKPANPAPDATNIARRLRADVGEYMMSRSLYMAVLRALPN